MTQIAEVRPEPSFEVGDCAVHPSHGAGKITAIEDKSFGETRARVYVINIFGSELKVMVPMSTASRVGLRPIMSAEKADELFDILRTDETAVAPQTWNRRFRAYTEMLSSGSSTEIAKVLRDMHRLKSEKELSFGERRLLDQALALLVEEIAIAKGQTAAQVTTCVEELFAS